MKLVADDIVNRFAVDGEDAITLSDVKSGCGAPGCDGSDFEHSGAPFGREHEIDVTGYLRSPFVGDLPEFSQHHDLVHTQYFLQIIDLFFGKWIFAFSSPEFCL